MSLKLIEDVTFMMGVEITINNNKVIERHDYLCQNTQLEEKKHSQLCTKIYLDETFAGEHKCQILLIFK